MFTYAAPDAMRYQIVNGPSAIQIGSDDYQLGPDGRWIANRRAVPFEWPRFYYAEVASGASITARESVGDAQATVVDFEFGGYQFRVWIDNLTARILQLSMDSPNHHMIAVYTDFDSAPPIERPTSLAP